MEYLKFIPTNEIIEEDIEDNFILFYDDKILIANDKYDYRNLNRKDIEEKGLEIYNLQALGILDSRNFFMGQVKDDLGLESLDLTSYGKKFPYDEFMMAARSKMILDFERKNQFCGVCGSKKNKFYDKVDRAFKCETCGDMTWMSSAPAIIVAVTKGDKILLGHNKNFPDGVYSVLAGYLEYGESFEDAVKREVFEETNIKIKNIQYFGSQIWPFPNSLMVAFKAEYLSGDIEVDQVEIVDADWFDREEAKKFLINSPSISKDMLEDFLEQGGKDDEKL